VFLRYAKVEKELCEKAGGLLTQIISPAAAHETSPRSGGRVGTAVTGASRKERRQDRIHNANEPETPFLTCYRPKTPCVM